VQPLGGASEVPNVHPADCFDGCRW